MAVIVIQQVAATEEQHRAVSDAIDIRGNPPAGLILHIAGPDGEGELRVVDVCESTEAFQTFAAERLGPTIAQVMGADAPKPRVEIRELCDVIKGASRAAPPERPSRAQLLRVTSGVGHRAPGGC